MSSDYNQADMDAILKDLAKSANITSQVAKQQQDMSRKAATAELERDKKRSGAIDKLAKASHKAATGLDKTGNAVENLLSGFGEASRHLSYVIRNFAGGAFLGLLINKSLEVTKVFQSMSSIGQNFGGSMLTMMEQAAAAGMPLEEFGQAVRKYGNVVAQTGVNDFGKLNKSLRDQMMRYGMLGMTTEQLTEFMGDNLETARITGTLNIKATATQTKKFEELARLTTGMASATGVARERIAELANQAEQSSLALGALYSMPQEIRNVTEKNLKEALTIFAAQPGEVGAHLSRLVADTFGAGNAVFTAEGKEMIDAGMSQLASRITTFSNGLKDGSMGQADALEALSYIRKEVIANAPNLRVLAASGNAAAANMLKFTQIVEISNEQLKKQIKQQEKLESFTKFMLNLEAAWSSLTATFKEGFFKGLKNTMKGLDDFGKSGVFKALEKAFMSLGTFLGMLIGKVFSPENIEKFTRVIGDLTTSLAGLSSDAIANFGSGILGLASLIGQLGGAVLSTIGFFTQHDKVLKGIILAFVGYKALMLAGGIAGSLKNLLGGRGKVLGAGGGSTGVMNVDAGIVNIGGGSGGMGFGGTGKGKGRGAKGGRLGGIKRGVGGLFKSGGLKNAMKGGLGGLKGLGSLGGLKALGGGIGKMGARMIPGVGLVLGAGAALGSLASGDFTGAALQAGSGVASMIPGLGTAASMALMGADIARQAGMFSSETANAETPLPSKTETPPDKNLSDMVKEIKMANENLMEMISIVKKELKETNRQLKSINSKA